MARQSTGVFTFVLIVRIDTGAAMDGCLKKAVVMLLPPAQGQSAQASDTDDMTKVAATLCARTLSTHYLCKFGAMDGLGSSMGSRELNGV